MKHFISEYWQVNLPDDWVGREDPDSTTLYHPEGTGELQISASKYETDISDDELLELVEEHLESGADVEEVVCGRFEGLTLDYEAEDEYWREWYLSSGPILLFVTYVCDLADEEKEGDLVEFILESLQ